MTYFDRITELTKSVPATLVDFCVPRVPARVPTQASSEFITNKEQGDWAEDLIFRAINEGSKNHVAIRYGKSDDLVAGEAGFDQFFQEFQNELDTIGKRPDLLILRKEDFREDLGTDISRIPHNEVTEYVKKAVAGIEVRSSAFLMDRYDEAMKVRTTSCTTAALEIRDRILREFGDLLDHDSRRHYIPLLEALTEETLIVGDFRVPSWSSSDRLVTLKECFKDLKKNIKDIQKRDYLSITPKAEDIKVVYKWIECFDVPHYYFQVFFDKVFGISFEQILTIISDPDNDGRIFSVEADNKNQNKTTFKIRSKIGTPLAGRVDEPTHSSVRKEIGRGRLLFYVTFNGGTAYLDLEKLREILGIDAEEF